MQNEKVYDIAIIGGGLAGLCLAIESVKQHFSVILFEKEEYPYHKVCGEYISFESWEFLQRLGVNLETMDLPQIKKLRLSNFSGKTYAFDLPLGGFGISRFNLDSQLYKLALAAGVDIFISCKVESISFHHEVFTVISASITAKAKVAIGSFGKRSNLDVKWKRPFTTQKPNALNNYIGIKYHIKYSHPSNIISLHNFHNGYCGLSRIEDGKSCLCYLTTADNLRKSENSVQQMEKQILFKNPQLKEIFSSAQFLFGQPLAISQISFNKKQQVENHVLMLGDAAGIISPLCGNGMSMAMHSATIAAGIIKRFLAGELSRTKMEEEYTYRWQKQFSKRLLIGRVVQRFFGGDTSTTFFLQTMKALPPLAKWIIQSTHGKPF